MVSHAGELKQQHTSFHNSHLTIRIPELCWAVIFLQENESYYHEWRSFVSFFS